MAAQSFELNAQIRTATGKANARRMRRREDLVPAILYGAGKEPEQLTLHHKDVLRASRHEAIFSSILTLDIDGKKQQAVFKAMQRHHTKPRIMHIDFQRIKASEKLTMMIPLHFAGEEICPGVVAGGIISHAIPSIEIRCLPAHLPPFIEVDVSKLELDQTLHLSDIKLPEGVELTVPHLDEEHNAPVVSVHVPRVSQADLEAEAAEATLAAEASAGAAETVEKTEDAEAASDSDESEKAEK
jgi:large subunit ribosomal protein L25